MIDDREIAKSRSYIKKYIEANEGIFDLNIQLIQENKEWATVPFYQPLNERLARIIFDAFRLAGATSVYALCPYDYVDAAPDFFVLPVDEGEFIAFCQENSYLPFLFLSDDESMVALATPAALSVIAGMKPYVQGAIQEPIPQMWLQFRESIFCREHLIDSSDRIPNILAEQDRAYQWGRKYEFQSTNGV